MRGSKFLSVVAGLAAFKLKQYDVGATHFAAMADNAATTSWLKSAAAFFTRLPVAVGSRLSRNFLRAARASSGSTGTSVRSIGMTSPDWARGCPVVHTGKSWT